MQTKDEMNKLNKGQVFKNRKVLCEYLGWKVPNGTNGNEAFKKRLSSLCEYHKEGNKFIIDEVFEEVKLILRKESKVTKGKEYIENIENIILNLILDNDKTYLDLGTNQALKQVGLININYTTAKHHQGKYAKLSGYDLDIINEFFQLNNKAAINDFEKALKNLKKRGLIFYTNCILINKRYTHTISKTIIIEGDSLLEEDNTSQVTYENYDYFADEVATDEDVEIILNAKNEALKVVECASISQLYLYKRGRIGSYWKKVYELLAKRISNFNGFRNGYHIVPAGDIYLEKRLISQGYVYDDEVSTINDCSIKKLASNTNQRRSRAMKKVDGLNDLDIVRQKSNYIETTKALFDDLLDKEAKDIRQNILDVVLTMEEVTKGVYVPNDLYQDIMNL